MAQTHGALYTKLSFNVIIICIIICILVFTIINRNESLTLITKQFIYYRDATTAISHA